jgi:hypothetical protein|tara:strand:+ start:1114 stop:1224 length:111 start_codon:yes stop_codon:yes gene_type:complete
MKEKEFKFGKLLLFLAAITVLLAIISFALDRFILVY